MAQPPNPFEIGDKDDGHSLPVPEQIRTENMIHKHQMQEEEDSRAAFKKNRRKSMIILVAGIVSFFAILGFMVAFFTKGERDAKESAFEIQEGRQEGVDPTVWESVMTLLLTYTPPVKLHTPGTPQNLAANWLCKEVEGGVAQVPPSREYEEAYPFVQRYSMATFYYGTNGPSWPNQFKFLSADSVCSWHEHLEVEVPQSINAGGIAIGEYVPGTVHLTGGVKCNDDDEIVEVKFASNNLEGELPPEVGLLEALQHFAVWDNKLNGSLPNSLQYLNDMVVFIVEENELSGSIPEWVDQWEWLETISLANNQFSGSLPSFASSPNLENVALNGNQFSGGIDMFNENWNLKILFMQNNQFTGPINPNTLNEVRVRKLDMSNNQITGQLTTYWYEMELVDLHNNQISGPLPIIDDDDYEIQFLSVFDNNMIGNIPDNIGELVDLYHLDLSANGFTGTIPTSMNDLSSLKYVYLGDNNFDQQEFPYLADCSDLEELSVRNCNIDDTFPHWIGNWMDNIILLDVTSNSIYGEIKESLGWATTLRFVLLSRNNLEGPVPNNLWDLRDLNVLTVDHNPLLTSMGNVCNSDGPQDLEHVLADCTTGCTCCDTCCNVNDGVCGSETVTPNLVSGYARDTFVFSAGLVFESNNNGN